MSTLYFGKVSATRHVATTNALPLEGDDRRRHFEDQKAAGDAGGYIAECLFQGEANPRRRWRVEVMHAGQTIAVLHAATEPMMRELAQAVVDRDLGINRG